MGAADPGTEVPGYFHSAATRPTAVVIGQVGARAAGLFYLTTSERDKWILLSVTRRLPEDAKLVEARQGCR